MDNLRLTLRYWKTVIQTAWNIAVIESEMKTAIRAIMAAEILALAFLAAGALGIISPNATIISEMRENFLLTVALSFVSAIVFLVIFVFVFVYVPAKMHQEIIDIHKERLARVDGLSSEVVKGKDEHGTIWVGVSISNARNNLALWHPVFILEDVEGLNDFQVPIELHMRGRFIRPFQVIPGGPPCVFDVVVIRDGKAGIESVDRDSLPIPAGKYSIRTSLRGSFDSSSFEMIEPKDEHWLLTVGDDNSLDLVKDESPRPVSA